jgi:hypothetical protein
MGRATTMPDGPAKGSLIQQATAARRRVKAGVKALRTGRHMGTSRQILPPMPWTAFRNATDEDLKSIYACLRSIPPVVNHVADAQPADATAVAATK